MAEAFERTRAERVYLIDLAPYDPAAGATVTLRVATKGVATGPGESPANAFYEPVVREALNVQRSMWQPGAIGGRAIPDRGSLVLVNASGRFDAWLGYHWDGRAITVRLGVAGDPVAAYETVFTGVTGEPTARRGEIALAVFDKSRDLDRLMQETLYAGSGGAEGGDDLKSLPKPLCFGICRNVTPVVVDRTNGLYQVHDGPIEAVDAVYENGVLLTLTSDYTVDLAAGTITVPSTTGFITADVRGAKVGGVYISSVADIAEAIVTEWGPLAAADLDADSFAALNAANAAAVGLYTGTSAVNILDAIDRLVASVGGFYTFSTLGLMQVGRFEAPAGEPVLELDDNDIVRDGLSREPAGDVIWRRRLEYRRAWTVQYPDTLDPSATDAVRDFVARETRIATAADSSIKEDGYGGHIGAIDAEAHPTLLDTEADADAEADRLLALFGERAFVYRAQVKHRGFNARLGAVVRLTHPLFGLSDGKLTVIVGQGIRARTGDIELELWSQ